MSKKIQMLLVAGLVCVSLSGCGEKTNNENDANQGLSKESKTNESKTAVKNAGEESMIQTVKESGLADLVGRGAKVRCEYQVKEGDNEIKVTTYIDGEKFRAETNTGGMEAASVFDGDAYYSWVKGESKQGTKMTRSCMEETEASLPEGEAVQETNQFGSVDDIVSQESEVKMDCQEVDKVDLEIPTDINFMDTCKMMENVQNQTQNMEEIRKQMEQMQQGY